jgi:hypothetical protein
MTNPGTYSVFWISNQLMPEPALHLGFSETPDLKAFPPNNRHVDKVLFYLLELIESNASAGEIEAQWSFFSQSIFANKIRCNDGMSKQTDQVALKKARNCIVDTADKVTNKIEDRSKRWESQESNL